MAKDEKENLRMFEGTIIDVRFHNSKVGDDSWCDIVIRVQGQAGMISASELPRAKEKLVKIIFQIEK